MHVCIHLIVLISRNVLYIVCVCIVELFHHTSEIIPEIASITTTITTTNRMKMKHCSVQV